MFFLSTLSLLKIVHLIGLIMGFGGAIFANYTIFTRGVLRPVNAHTIQFTEFLSRIVVIGLVVLWASGILLVWQNLLVNPEYLTNQALWAKVLIVMVLTLNGALIHKLVLPMLSTSIGFKLFDHISLRRVLGITLIGGISLVSWCVPFVLGKSPELNFVTPMGTIVMVWAYCVMAVWIMQFTVMTNVYNVQGHIRRLLDATHQPIESTEQRPSSIERYTQSQPAQRQGLFIHSSPLMPNYQHEI